MGFPDEKNLKIISLLEKDFRMSIAEIARFLSISHNAVKYRLNKLYKEGVISSYPCFLNAEKFGKRIQVIFLFDFPSESLNDAIVRLSGYDEIAKIFRTSGLYPVVAVGLFESKEELSSFIPVLSKQS